MSLRDRRIDPQSPNLPRARLTGLIQTQIPNCCAANCKLALPTDAEPITAILPGKPCCRNWERRKAVYVRCDRCLRFAEDYWHPGLRGFPASPAHTIG